MRTAFTNPSRDRLRPVVKTVLAIVFFLVIVTIAGYLPGVDRLLPIAASTLGAIVSAVVALLVAGLLLHLATVAASLVGSVVDGPVAIVEHAASVVFWLIVLVAIVVAHAGIAPLASILLGDVIVLYDLTFLAMGAGVLIAIAVRLYDALDPASEYVTAVVLDDRGNDPV